MSTHPQTFLLAGGAAELQAGDAKPKRVKIIAYAGGEMRVEGWGPLVISLAGLQLPDAIPLLADHADSLAAMIGPASRASTGASCLSRGKSPIRRPGTLLRRSSPAERSYKHPWASSRSKPNRIAPATQ